LGNDGEKARHCENKDVEMLNEMNKDEDVGMLNGDVGMLNGMNKDDFLAIWGK
jgi:hypothetical protein